MRVPMLLAGGALCAAVPAALWLGGDPREVQRVSPTPASHPGVDPVEVAPGDLGYRAGVRVSTAVPVRVRVLEHRSKGAATVPDVRVVLGVARDRESAEAALAGERLELGAGTVDGDGRLDVELSVPESWLAGGPTWVWGRVTSPGFRSVQAARPLKDPTAGLELELLGRPGITLPGSVVQADGRPAAGVTVRLLEPAEVEGGWTSTYDDALTDAAGGFEIHSDGAGLFALQVLAGERGSAFRGNVEVRPDRLPDPLRLTLAGSGTLGGRVADPHGAPVRHYRLWALPWEWSGPYLNDTQRIERVRGEGSMDAYAVSDGRGAFRMGGLRPGRYTLWGYDGEEREYLHRLTHEPVELGRHDLELTVARDGLVVRVEDHLGEPRVPGVMPSWGPNAEKGLSLYCRRVDDPQREVRATVAEEAVAFEVRPGAYAVGVLGPEHPLREELVQVVAGEYDRQVLFQLAPPEPPGELELRVLRPDGRDFTEHLNVSVDAPGSGTPLSQGDRYLDGPSFEVRLPAGRYRVRVDATPLSGHHGERFEATPYLPAELDVVLRSGERSSFDVTLGASGRLGVLLTAPEGWDEARRDLRPPPGAGYDEAERLEAGGARLSLHPVDGGDPIPPVFYLRPDDLPTGRPRFAGAVVSWVPPGLGVASVDPIPVGEYRLRIEAPACEPLEVPVAIRAGATERVERSLRLR